MGEQAFSFVPLSVSARPPRLVVVVPHDEDWVRWMALGLARVSQLWGGSGSVVVPAAAVGHAGVERALAQFGPDHVVAYNPSWGSVDKLFPGLVDRFIAGQQVEDGAAREAATQMLRDTAWSHAIVAQAEGAAEDLRSRLAVNRREDLVQLTHVFDSCSPSDLTELGAVAQVPLYGVPRAMVTTIEALSCAMAIGVQEQSGTAEVEVSAWQAAMVHQAEPEAVSEVRIAAGPDALAVRSHEAALCISVQRGIPNRDTLLVFGGRPEDYALAEVLRQTHGRVSWVPWNEPSRNEGWLYVRSYTQDRILATSASLNLDEVRERIDVSWRLRIPSVVPERDVAPEVVSSAQVNFSCRQMVVLRDAWEQPRSLPVLVGAEGTLDAALSLPGEVPAGLDADRHRWQVTLTTNNHPVPPLHTLTSSAVIATDQNPWETFARPADGGITYWSHRFDFVSAGASLAGRLAAPRLSWPAIGKVLQHAAAAQRTEIRPSAAGKRAAIAERLLGSRTDLERLASSPGWPVLRAFTSKKADWELPPGSVWKLKSGLVLSWDAVAAYESKDWDEHARRGELDRWASQGVVRRGFVLGCCHCPIFEFYPLAEITQHYSCRRCGGENSLSQERWKSPLSEPAWYYELHPAVRELVENDGDVPLLATQFLRTQHWARPSLVSEEFEVLRGGNPFVEIDFALATLDQVWLGEAKSGDALASTAKEQKREVCKLIEGCTTLGAGGLVLATSKPRWSDATVQILRREVEGRRAAERMTPKIILLAGLATNPGLTALEA
ncbi:hypothetical protein ACFRSX_36480 [Streptomyces goshikiensis]|uniref:hypothetical protein n=1 Tax=Streptomyces TaxID=1883 RepID=UPI000C280648|nr:hypothetical protein [Streptomyces sp. CB02120-2]PJN13841.1 hypothetical protein CG724_37460 [Streptomyces sp. CB02120-2]